jgi:hypothetical protein
MGTWAKAKAILVTGVQQEVFFPWLLCTSHQKKRLLLQRAEDT